MRAYECTCRQFLDGHIQYVVPSFQRPYSWKQDRWQTFLDGVLEVCDKEQWHEIFLGAIAVMPVDPTPSGLQKFLLVDGQQRLITVMALLAALRNIVRPSDPGLAGRITSQCLLNPDEEWNYRYKLLPKETNRKSFFRTLDEAAVELDSLFPATAFFMRQLEFAACPINCRDLHDLLLDHFMIVRIDLEKDENPYPIFKSLNMTEDPTPMYGLEEYHRFASDPQIMALIAAGESQQVEFKEAVSVHTDDAREAERHGATIARTVAAFMNSHTGGSLLIGVADDGTVTGINAEYGRIDKGKANWDGYHLHVRNMLRARLSIENPFRFYAITRHVLDGRDVCRITVKPAPAPVYIDKHLYVRSGNQTLEMRGPDLVEFVRTRWE